MWLLMTVYSHLETELDIMDSFTIWSISLALHQKLYETSEEIYGIVKMNQSDVYTKHNIGLTMESELYN